MPILQLSECHLRPANDDRLLRRAGKAELRRNLERIAQFLRGDTDGVQSFRNVDGAGLFEGTPKLVTSSCESSRQHAMPMHAIFIGTRSIDELAKTTSELLTIKLRHLAGQFQPAFLAHELKLLTSFAQRCPRRLRKVSGREEAERNV
jgi:hypothetical protein